MIVFLVGISLSFPCSCTMSLTMLSGIHTVLHSLNCMGEFLVLVSVLTEIRRIFLAFISWFSLVTYLAYNFTNISQETIKGLLSIYYQTPLFLPILLDLNFCVLLQIVISSGVSPSVWRPALTTGQTPWSLKPGAGIMAFLSWSGYLPLRATLGRDASLIFSVPVVNTASVLQPQPQRSQNSTTGAKHLPYAWG